MCSLCLCGCHPNTTRPPAQTKCCGRPPHHQPTTSHHTTTPRHVTYRHISTPHNALSNSMQRSFVRRCTVEDDCVCPLGMVKLTLPNTGVVGGEFCYGCRPADAEPPQAVVEQHFAFPPWVAAGLAGLVVRIIIIIIISTHPVPHHYCFLAPTNRRHTRTHARTHARARAPASIMPTLVGPSICHAFRPFGCAGGRGGIQTTRRGEAGGEDDALFF